MNTKVSQGSVAQRLRCGGIFSNHSIRQSLLSLLVKNNFENRLIFSKVMGKSRVSGKNPHDVYAVYATATCLADWLGVCLSQPVLYQND